MSKAKRKSAEPRPGVGIKEMARELGISIGTVDRALHGRPGISPETRARVLQLAKALGYRPNLAARQLKSRRKLALAVILPRRIASFFDAVRDGIREGASPFASSVDLQFRSHDRLGEGGPALFEQALQNHAGGLIVCPGRPDEFRPLIQRANAGGVPVVCVASDAPGSGRLTAVMTDPGTGGAMAAELFSWLLPAGSQCAILTGDLSTVDHCEKVAGFRGALADFARGLQLAAIAETHDDERQAYECTCAIVRQHPGLRGIYVSTANSVPVLAAVKELGLAGRLALITTDLFDAVASAIRSGLVSATLYQRPVSQGSRAIQALYRYIAEGVRPPRQIRLAPHVVMRSNLDLLLHVAATGS